MFLSRVSFFLVLFMLFSIVTHLNWCILLHRLLFIKVKAVKCQNCSLELRRFLEQVDRGLCWERIKKWARGKTNLQWVSVRAPDNCSCLFQRIFLLSRLSENIEIIITGPVIVAPIQLFLWKSVGAFSVSLWELSQTLHLFESICFHLMLIDWIRKMLRDTSWRLWYRHESSLQAKDLYSFVSFSWSKLNLLQVGQ